MSRTIAVLDANVLYGIVPADLLVTLALHGLFRPHWTEAIFDEAIRNIVNNRPDLDPDKVAYRFRLMDEALAGACLPPPAEALVDQMTSDIDDRHVLAAAVTIGAGVIVTENLRHFPSSACAPYGIIAMSLDDFIGGLLEDHLAVVRRAVAEMASRRRLPPITPDDLLTVLERYVPSAAQRLR